MANYYYEQFLCAKYSARSKGNNYKREEKASRMEEKSLPDIHLMGN
jgi:hypothetical protein